MPPIGGPGSLYQRDLIPRPLFNTRNSSKPVRGRGHIQKINVINISRITFRENLVFSPKMNCI